MPTYLISYDIKETRALQKVAKKLQAEGLERVLKSVFLGSLSSLTIRKLRKWLENTLLDGETSKGQVMILALTATQIDQLYLIGSFSLNREELKGAKHTLFC